MNKDLERLLELEKQRHDECNETEWLKWHDDYDDVKSKLNEKLEKTEKIKILFVKWNERKIDDEEFSVSVIKILQEEYHKISTEIE